jgi:glycosyltransferase involved in cell wall biosynthesis
MLAQARQSGMTEPRLVVFSSLFPAPRQPTAGVFVRERAFRVGKVLPLVVVSPKPWFPGEGLIRWFRPTYRPKAPIVDEQFGVEVLFPRFLSIPGLLRRLDGLSMAVFTYRMLRRLKARGYNVIDAHFAYPDGYAAVLLGRWLGLPVTVTLRGTEGRLSRDPVLASKLRTVFHDAQFVIAVSDSLRQLAVAAGLPEGRGQVVGNGIDLERFRPVAKIAARRRLGLAEDDRVLITVGGLVERKGFHRVIAAMPSLVEKHPALHYLVVGGPCPEGDMGAALRAQAAELGLSDKVRFLGPMAPDDLKWPLSAADVFVLASRNEGWANVILEAMACGLPVVATSVGGNAEVVADERLGTIVPFDDPGALVEALDDALLRDWDRGAIRAHAEANSWDSRIHVLTDLFRRIVEEYAVGTRVSQ